MTIKSSSSAKQAIFQRLKGLCEGGSPASIAEQAEALLAPSRPANNPLRQRLLADTAIDAFIERIEQGKVIGTSIRRIDTTQALPQAVADQMTQWHADGGCVVQPTNALQQLDWTGINCQDSAEQVGSTSVVLADYGIAETATAVIHSSSDMPILNNFLALYQIIVIKADSIVNHLENYSDIAQTKQLNPRNTCLITGASGTTDIEGVLVQGAHGPKALHLVIVGG